MSRTSSRKVTIYSVLIVVCIVLLHYIGWLGFIERGLRKLTTPIMESAHEAGVAASSRWHFFQNNSEYGTLEQKYNELQHAFDIQTAQYKLTTEENSDLRKQLSFEKRHVTAGVMAEIISQETINNEQTIIIDKGSKNGLKVGQAVVAADGILVGTLIKTEDDIAIIRLLNDSQSRIGARVLNKDQSMGVVEGGYRVSLRMNLIPRDEKVLVGDQIVTSGIEQGIPKGLVIGTVAVVENEPYQPFQQAILTPAIDYNKLANVKVLTPTDL